MSSDSLISSISWETKDEKELFEREAKRRGMSKSALFREIVNMYISRNGLEAEIEELEREISEVDREIEELKAEKQDMLEVLEYKKELLTEKESVSAEIEMKLDYLAAQKQVGLKYEANPRYEDVLQQHSAIQTREELEGLIGDRVEDVDPEDRLPRKILKNAPAWPGDSDE